MDGSLFLKLEFLRQTTIICYWQHSDQNLSREMEDFLALKNRLLLRRLLIFFVHSVLVCGYTHCEHQTKDKLQKKCNGRLKSRIFPSKNLIEKCAFGAKIVTSFQATFWRENCHFFQATFQHENCYFFQLHFGGKIVVCFKATFWRENCY